MPKAKVYDISTLQHANHHSHYAHSLSSGVKARKLYSKFVTEDKMRTGATSAEKSTRFGSSDLTICCDCIH